MASVASQLMEEVTTHAQRDSLNDAREICADGTYFPNNLCKFVLPFQIHSPLTNDISYMGEDKNVKLQSTLTEIGLCYTCGSEVAHHFAPR